MFLERSAHERPDQPSSGVAIITGGSRGLGRAIARGLSVAGMATVLVARDQYGLEEASVAIGNETGVPPETIAADLLIPANREAVVATSIERFGRIDVLVNNAGTPACFARAENVSSDEWESDLMMHLTVPFHLSQLVHPYMAAQGSGRIINVSSVVTHRPMYRTIGYSTAKAAVEQLTRCLALEWAVSGITVNAVAPGIIETQMTKGLIDDPDRSKPLLARIPGGQPGVPQDVVGAVLLLASTGGQYINGSVITVDGGYLLT
jgi:2-deoxy-D-gluconate 3-dehydrogenase